MFVKFVKWHKDKGESNIQMTEPSFKILTCYKDRSKPKKMKFNKDKVKELHLGFKKINCQNTSWGLFVLTALQVKNISGRVWVTSILIRTKTNTSINLKKHGIWCVIKLTEDQWCTSTFLRTFWPSVCLLWENVYSVLLPIFKLDLFFFFFAIELYEFFGY